jgi:hypothetical protein
MMAVAVVEIATTIVAVAVVAAAATRYSTAQSALVYVVAYSPAEIALVYSIVPPPD